jgi:hypothetical protein
MQIFDEENELDSRQAFAALAAALTQRTSNSCSNLTKICPPPSYGGCCDGVVAGVIWKHMIYKAKDIERSDDPNHYTGQLGHCRLP